jgi:hypothetical protein
MMRVPTLLLGGLLASLSVVGSAQPTSGCGLSNQPGLSVVGGLLYYCSSANTWTAVTVGSTIPSGAIVFLTSGTCPAGWTEVSALSGKTLIGTVAANGDVGTTGGSDTITPAGTTTAPTFTGSSSVTSAQTFTGSSATTSAVSAGTPAGTNGATATSGNCTATNLAIGTGALSACKATAPNLTVPAEGFTGSALSPHSHTLTATGTNGTGTVTPLGTVAAPVFTGTQFDNRSSWTKVIACAKL